MESYMIKVVFLGLLLPLHSNSIFHSDHIAIKLQKQNVIPETTPFPCPLGTSSPGARSPTPPTSVHQLRPGDIDVVAAIGDSLSAATGAISKTLYNLFIDNRGMSFIAGGQGTWREILTLPNILKLYNKNLTGFSLGDGRSETKNAQFNVAVAGAMDQDMIYEAKELVRRLRNDARVDFKHHWKLISIWVGTNDICSDQCYDTKQGVAAHVANIEATIDYLYQHVPRVYVALISSPYIPSYAELQDLPSICLTSLGYSCSCLFKGDEETKLRKVTAVTREFQKAEEELAKSTRFMGREDFTVEFQPTFQDSHFPQHKNQNGKLTTDYSYMSVDCFHYSQKLHAVAANTIWNNLLEPPWDKTTTWQPLFQRFLCPSENRSFLVTRHNSKHWRMGRF